MVVKLIDMNICEPGTTLRQYELSRWCVQERGSWIGGGGSMTGFFFTEILSRDSDKSYIEVWLTEQNLENRYETLYTHSLIKKKSLQFFSSRLKQKKNYVNVHVH